jgi:hypothetical protein
VKDQKAMLIELANALDAASALARMIAEQPEKEVKIKLDEQTFSQAVLGAIHGNPEA